MCDFSDVSLQTIYDQSIHLLKLKQVKQAIDLAQKLYQQAPKWGGSHRLLGILHVYQKNQAHAQTALLKALQLDPQDSESLFYLLQLAVEPEHKLKWCRLYLPQVGRSKSLYLLAADVFKKVQDWQGMQACLLSALKIDPELQTAQALLAEVYLHQADYQKAFPYLQAYLNQIPNAATQVYQAATLLMNRHQARSACDYFGICLEFYSQMPVTQDILYAQYASCLQAMGDSELARQAYQKASDVCQQGLLYRWPKINALPYIYEDLNQIQSIRQNFRFEINQWIQEIDLALDQKEDLIPLMAFARPPFLLSYHGLNNQDLMAQIGATWHRILEQSGCLFQSQHKPKQNQKIRIGFVSSFFYHHSVMIAYSRQIFAIAEDPDFEVFCIHLGNHLDQQSARVQESVHQFIHLNGVIEPQSILNLNLDILLYLDIGMETKTYQLAFHRLAPIQCVVLGHPDTTGIPNIDYYLSNIHLEKPDAQQHYTEQLVLSERSFSTAHALDLSSYQPLSKQDIGFQITGPIYFCPMTLFKVHPDFMQAVADILRQDLSGKLYFVADQEGFWAQKLQTVFEQKYSDICSRIAFLPWMEQNRFYSAIQQADAVLDTFHFGGGTTSRICIDLNQAILTWPGKFARGRMTMALYHRMGLHHLVSVSPTAYVEDALKMANDQDYRQQQQSLITERKHGLYLEEQTKATESIKNLFRNMLRVYPGKLKLIPDG